MCESARDYAAAHKKSDNAYVYIHAHTNAYHTQRTNTHTHNTHTHTQHTYA